jgi:hypothetical protein
MKYHICIETEAAGAIAEREDPTSESVGYLVEDTFEADNIEEATKIAKEWTAKRILSLPRDAVTVIIEEIETGQHHQLNMPVPSLESVMSEAEKTAQLERRYELLEISVHEADAEIARLKERCALLDSLLVEVLRSGYLNETACSPSWLREARKAVALSSW